MDEAASSCASACRFASSAWAFWRKAQTAPSAMAAATERGRETCAAFAPPVMLPVAPPVEDLGREDVVEDLEARLGRSLGRRVDGSKVVVGQTPEHRLELFLLRVQDVGGDRPSTRRSWPRGGDEEAKRTRDKLALVAGEPAHRLLEVGAGNRSRTAELVDERGAPQCVGARLLSGSPALGGQIRSDEGPEVRRLDPLLGSVEAGGCLAGAAALGLEPNLAHRHLVGTLRTRACSTPTSPALNRSTGFMIASRAASRVRCSIRSRLESVGMRFEPVSRASASSRIETRKWTRSSRRFTARGTRRRCPRRPRPDARRSTPRTGRG